jgi:hypothetical protein
MVFSSARAFIEQSSHYPQLLIANPGILANFFRAIRIFTDQISQIAESFHDVGGTAVKYPLGLPVEGIIIEKLHRPPPQTRYLLCRRER